MWIGYPHMPTGSLDLFEKLVVLQKTSNIAD
jgi:hypothetical protein